MTLLFHALNGIAEAQGKSCICPYGAKPNPPVKVDPSVKVSPPSHMNPLDDGELPVPWWGSPRKGWVSGLVLEVREMFKAVTRKLCGL